MVNTDITLVEEGLLLLHHEEPLNSYSLHIVLAGAVLMELAIRNRADCGLDSFTVIDSNPTGDPILDRYFQQISAKDTQQEVKFWLKDIADDGKQLVKLGFNGLIERGILGKTEKRLLWVLKTKTYPTLDSSVEHNAKLRLMKIIYNDDMPDSRDVAIFSLLDHCDLFRALLPPAEVTRLQTKIRNISQLNPIGIEASSLISEHNTFIAVVAGGGTGGGS